MPISKRLKWYRLINAPSVEETHKSPRASEDGGKKFKNIILPFLPNFIEIGSAQDDEKNLTELFYEHL